MKQPQLGLRLLLLLVALAAIIVAWRRAVDNERREERIGKTVNHEVEITLFEKTLATEEEELLHPKRWFPSENYRSAVASYIEQLKDQIAELKRQVDAIRNPAK